MEPNQPPQQDKQYTPNPNRNIDRHASNHDLSVMAEGEQVIFDIKRHPIGMIFNYLIFGSLLAVCAVVAIIAPSLVPDFDRRMVSMIALGTFLALTIFIVIIMAITRHIYYGNRWVLTDDSITQYDQRGIFDRRSSQLGMDSLEDVTVIKKGILPHIFNYGILRSETAGENSKFSFSYCADPEQRAQEILAAHEMFEEREQWKRDSPQPVQRSAP